MQRPVLAGLYPDRRLRICEAGPDMPSRSLASRLRTATSMPREVLAFKARQHLQLSALRALGGWERVEAAVASWWTAARVDAHLASQPRGVLVAPDAVPALLHLTGSTPTRRQELVEWGTSVQGRRFEVLGEQIPEQGPWPWHADWRYGHSWPPRPPGSRYDFYRPRDRPQPYDVRFPWELNRLGFLLPAIQADALTGETSGSQFAMDVIADWSRHNAMASSIAWHPMEASMRAINVCLLLQVRRLLGTGNTTADRAPLLHLLSAHGEFIWRTREFTDVRGNHYAANVAALAVLGLELEETYPPATAWLDFGRNALSEEILGQLLPDGVDFEKSTAYHRLVTAVFLLAAVGLARAGLPISGEAERRLRRAVRYCADITRQDGHTPHVGDSDDTVVLPFDPCRPDDGRPLVATGAVLLGIPDLAEVGGRLPAAACWLAGEKAVTSHAWDEANIPDVRAHYRDAGVVVVRDSGSFLWIDVGEVGLHGRGGHGHNDLLSFELGLGGVPVVIDPGTYMYTGDSVARDSLRGTYAHNGLVVDGEEIAPLGTVWRISGTAQPVNVDVSLGQPGAPVTVSASHTGYLRLPMPVVHERRMTLDPAVGRFQCLDRIHGAGDHRVERLLHLAPGILVDAREGRAELSAAGRHWRIRYDEQSTLRLQSGWVSSRYGLRQTAPVLTLESRTGETSSTWFTVETVGSGGAQMIATTKQAG